MVQSMTLDELRKYKPQIEQIAAKYGITNIRVFGSTVRGDARVDSDVDLLADLSLSHGFDFIRAKREIGEFIGRHIDIVDDSYMDKYIAPYILKEVIPL
jgi:predicted nucleotidyltransferase